MHWEMNSISDTILQHAKLWPSSDLSACVCARERLWASPARLMSSYELSRCLIIKMDYECFMWCGARSRWLLSSGAVLSAPRHKAELQTSLQSTLLHMLPVNIDNHAILTNVLYNNKNQEKKLVFPYLFKDHYAMLQQLVHVKISVCKHINKIKKTLKYRFQAF